MVGVNFQQLSKWVFEKLQEKSEIDKMEKVLRKKRKKRKEKETVKRAREKKDEEEENGIPPTNIMIMVQNFLLFL